MTDISVVMAVYNGAEVVGETIDSVLGQDADFEFVIVDDGSADATPRLLAEAAARDPRVRVLRQENAGLTRALIAGCAAARGRYIARQDAGDLSRPGRLRALQRLLDGDERVVCVASSTEFVGPRGEYLFTSRLPAEALAPMQVLEFRTARGTVIGPTHHGAAMFRRDAYERAGGYRAAWYYGQDWDLWYRLAGEGLFQLVDEPLYVARVTPDSISGAARAAQQELAKLSYAALEARARGESDAEIAAAAARIGRAAPLGARGRARGLYFIGEGLRRNRDRRARGYLRQAIAADPLYWRAWLRYAQALAMR